MRTYIEFIFPVLLFIVYLIAGYPVIDSIVISAIAGVVYYFGMKLFFRFFDRKKYQKNK